MVYIVTDSSFRKHFPKSEMHNFDSTRTRCECSHISSYQAV